MNLWTYEALLHLGPLGSGTAKQAVADARYDRFVERAITGYHRDEQGDWVAELSCVHDQHVRHRPPFQLRSWVEEDKSRNDRLGTPLDCPPCDRAELPDGLRLVRSSPKWDEHTMPAGLLHAHRVAAGTWGRIVVHDGQLRFAASTKPALDVALGRHATQAIPPDVDHQVQPLGPVRFSIDFLAVNKRSTTPSDVAASHLPQRPGTDHGGDPACWAGLLCAECGAILRRWTASPRLPGPVDG